MTIAGSCSLTGTSSSPAKSGALSELPMALSARAFMLLFAGELAAAAALVQEVQAAMEATGSNLAPYAAMGLAAFAR